MARESVPSRLRAALGRRASGAAGKHQDLRTKRLRTRAARDRQARRDQE